MAKAKDVPGLSADLPFRIAAGRTVRVRAEELFEAREGVMDTEDIEGVHRMRVASRRLRAVLEVYAPCFPRKEHAAVLKEVKKLADALGERRDPDVQLDALTKVRDALDPADAAGLEVLTEQLRARQAAGNGVLADALEHADGIELHARLVQLAASAEGDWYDEPEHPEDPIYDDTESEVIA